MPTIEDGKLTATSDINSLRERAAKLNEQSRHDLHEELKKAARVYPPEENVVEVDMTKFHLAMIALGITTTGLGAATAYLWRKVKKQDEQMEAVSEYLSRLINRTDCGRKAYETFLEDEGLEAPVNWSESENIDEDDLAEKIDRSQV